MVQHVADLVAQFPHSQHSSLPPLNSLHTPPSTLLFLTPLRVRELRKIIITRASYRINILKAPAGTNWGRQKETVHIAYKSLIQFLFIHITAVIASSYSIEKL